MSKPETIVDETAPRVLLEVFGCQMNVVDAELVLGRLRKLRYVETRDYDAADVVVFNTCSVRGHAEDRVISRLGALRQWKRSKRGRVLAVMGCMAQREAADIRRRMPHVDVITGTKDFPKLADLVEQARAGSGPFIVIDGELRPDIERMPVTRPQPYQAYVTIMRGCNRPCTYCIVPTVRGREVSRPVEEVVSEVEALVGDGVVEICLLGQTVNAYDGGSRGAATLGTLLRRLDRVPGLRRLRFVTSHPRDFDDDTMDAMGECSKLDRFLHMPVQSGSDRILRAMKRGYSVERYRRIVDAIRTRVPDMQIGCDWIVGFPGETEEDFAQSVALCEEMRFVQSFVFKYSPRPGTEAEQKLVDDVPDAVKKERNQRLLAAQESVSIDENKKRIGSEAEILIEGTSRIDETRLMGRDSAHRIVVVPRGTHEGLRAGAFARVRIVDSTALTLVGEVLELT